MTWAMPSARATHAAHRANLRCLGLPVGIAIALSGCQKHDADAQTVAMHSVSDPDMPYREQAALELLRLGYERWVIACAWQTARHGGTQKDAAKNCRVDFGLNPASGIAAPSGGETAQTGSTPQEPRND